MVAFPALLMAFALSSAGAPDRNAFRWRAPILEPLQSGTLYRAIIPFHVMDGCKAYPADLRLLDSAGHECPFFIQTDLTPDTLLALPAALVDPPSDEPAGDGVSRFYLDMGFRSVPLSRLIAQAAETNFARSIKVFGRVDATNAWRWMAEGGIYRLQEREREWVDLNNQAFRYLKIEVLNYDEPVVTFTNIGVWADPQYLVFQADCDGAAWLYFGSDALHLPLGELRHRVSARAVAVARHAAIGPRELNPFMLRADLWGYARLLLITSLSICGVLALGILLRRIKA